MGVVLRKVTPSLTVVLLPSLNNSCDSETAEPLSRIIALFVIRF